MGDGQEFSRVIIVNNSIQINFFKIYMFKYDVSFELDIKLFYVFQIEQNVCERVREGDRNITFKYDIILYK